MGANSFGGLRQVDKLNDVIRNLLLTLKPGSCFTYLVWWRELEVWKCCILTRWVMKTRDITVVVDGFSVLGDSLEIDRDRQNASNCGVAESGE